MIGKTIIKDLEKIELALLEAGKIACSFAPKDMETELKSDKTIVTKADLAVDRILKEILPVRGEGWLSEETADDKERLNKKRVWVVDPIDGTIEFASGIPQWAISIGLIEEGKPIAGGIYNPIRNQLVLGAIGEGVTLNGKVVKIPKNKTLNNSKFSVSNSEYMKGQWNQFRKLPIDMVVCGSTAYKIARVAAGIDDASFTFTSKKEWDIAAGFCLVNAAGGTAFDINGNTISFNQSNTKHHGYVVGPKELVQEVLSFVNN